MFAFVTNREIYREYLQQLQVIYNPGEATVITNLVFESIAGLQRANIIKLPQQLVDPFILEHLIESLSELIQHKPVQYVLGEAWFYKMKLSVNNQVLIPRPETEELVKLIIDDHLPAVNQNALTATSQMSPGKQLTILDIGTGSGCIAIALKKNLPVTMTAIDISKEALLVAGNNAKDLAVEITFLHVDFLAEADWHKLPVFDVIVSNPPYIPLDEKSKLDKNVIAFEPHAALFVPKKNPLLFYEKIAAFGKKHLHEHGKVYVEINEKFAGASKEIFKRYDRVTIKQDIFGKDRFLTRTCI
ncbi:MAG: peptide chain release factor N(5)-glutamine methyltransferase [Ferruginibacter sp.]